MWDGSRPLQCIDYWNMDLDIHIYLDVQSFRTSNGESYSSGESRCGEIQMRRNTVRRETLRMFFLVLYNQLTIYTGKLIVLQGSWFTTIGIMESCIQCCGGVARNGTGNLDGLP